MPSPYLTCEQDNLWQTVLDLGKEYDKELVENWRDELNNLLIFVSARCLGSDSDVH